MKINEVPQDPKNFKEGENLRKLMYAVDKDGKYTGVNSAGWEAENFAMKQAWDEVEQELAETETKVKAGELSPLAYFMQKTLMDVPLLAKYVGKWEWQVKRHMKPSVFQTLKPETLQKYATIFNITVDELTGFGK
ncbi:hypothetical protein [Polluticoccus soli]|uniref:hypothetical protein n=1 Tax=Polluticoccus soli TaxID=3034150 RepID=UPI0023E0AF6D|nr:hypothetical protein [Flavipsychrobacter sp. JY13-12]